MLLESFQLHVKPTNFSMYAIMKQKVFHNFYLKTFVFKQILNSLLFTIFPCIVFSQSSIDDSQTMLSKQAMMRNAQLKFMKVEAELSITINENTNSADCLMKMAGRDSLSMEVSGPFGISVARLYSNSKFFLFHDMLQGRAIEGKPTRETLSEVTFLPLSFEDYASLFRAEPPGNIQLFTPVESYSDSVKSLYKRVIDPSATEFLLCNKVDGTIREYQRKNKEGILELSMVYDKYTIINGIPMPSIVSLNSPLRGVSVTVTAQSISVNDSIPSVMRFPLPASITPLRMD